MKLDWRAIAVGAVVALVVFVPVSLLHSLLRSNEDPDGVIFVFVLPALAAFVVGGFVAGAKRPDTPLAHGTAAAVVAFVGSRVVTTIVQAAGDDGVDVKPVAFATNVLFTATLGMLGGWLAGRRANRHDQELAP